MGSVPDDQTTEPESIEEGDRYLAGTDPAVELEVIEIVEADGTTYCRIESTRLGRTTTYRRSRRDVRSRLRCGDYQRLRTP